jgi:molecular chaperone GrpE (heat shock protein)
METERGPTTLATMANGDSNVVEGRGTKTLSPEAKPFTLTISSSLPTGYRRRTAGNVMGSTSKTSFPPTQAVRHEQTEAYHMSGATVPLAPRPQWDASRVPKPEEKRPETVPSMKTPPHSHDEKGALIKESKWQQMCHDHELLRRDVERLEKQLEDDRLEFEAVGRPQADVEALKEERVELVRMNRSQANRIRKLQDEVKKLKTKPERLQSMYERYAKDYEEKLDEAETRATALENKLKEFKC